MAKTETGIVVYSGQEDRLDWRYLQSYKRLYQTEKDFTNPKKSQQKKRKHNSSSKGERVSVPLCTYLEKFDRQSSTGGCSGR